MFSLNALIQHQSLTIVRVPKGFYGLATDAGMPVILGEGLHVRNSPLFVFGKLQDVNVPYINHATIHILRVPPGFYAKVVENNVPKLLTTGFYVINSNYFKYVPDFVDASTEYINHQTIRLVRVPKNYLTAVMLENKPALLPEGQYQFNTQFFTYGNKVLVTEEFMQHNTITRVRVTNGKICAAWYRNRPIFISKPGTYEIDDKDFIFVSMFPATNRSIVLHTPASCHQRTIAQYTNTRRDDLNRHSNRSINRTQSPHTLLYRTTRVLGRTSANTNPPQRTTVLALKTQPKRAWI